MTKLSSKTPEKHSFKQPIKKDVNQKRFDKSGHSITNVFNKFRRRFTNKGISVHRNDHTGCPRGFGDIKKLNRDSSISERCLGCYNIMECYDKNKFEN